MNKKMTAKELVDTGLLQEVNRLFFHPRGLALGIKVDDDGNYSLDDVWDSREDPEGFWFSDISEDKKKYAKELFDSKDVARVKKIGSVIQEKSLEH